MAEHFGGGPPLPLGPGSGLGEWQSLYQWIPVAGGFLMCAWSVMIGANDLAFSFATSVGSGALTMVQAILIAAIFEISGAVLVGERFVDSLQSHVLKQAPPSEGLFMWGLFIALLVATVWLAVATYWELPVSASLCVWAALIGISLTTDGWSSIYWSNEDSPWLGGGVYGVALSWVLAPTLACSSSFLFFTFTKYIFLRSHNSERRTLRALPVYYGITVAVLIYFIIYKGCPGLDLMKIGPARASLIAVLSGVTCSIIVLIIVTPLARKRLGCLDGVLEKKNQASTSVETPNDEQTEAMSSAVQLPKEMTPDDFFQQFSDRRALDPVLEGDEDAENGLSESFPVSLHCKAPCVPTTRISFGQLLARTPSKVLTFKRLRVPTRKATTRQKMTSVFSKFGRQTFVHKVEYDRETLVMHALSEKFDVKVEELFSFLQILTACASAFAYGSNDVAAAAGPYASILQIYRYRQQLPELETPIWIIALGAVGASVGFALFGWKLVRCLGGRLIYLSPSRGFTAQLCAIATMLVTSRTPLPCSVTHILIGSLLGVGAADSFKNMNWQLVLWFIVGWVMIFFSTCMTSTALYSFTIYSPSYSVG